MTLPVAALDEYVNVTWTVRCTSHSEPDPGVHVCVCSAVIPEQPACPCEVGDRYVIVETARAERRWQECADGLICTPQLAWSAALRATNNAMDQLPGCTLAAAFVLPSGCVLRNRKGTALLTRHRLAPTLLAAYAHFDQRQDHGG